MVKKICRKKFKLLDNEHNCSGLSSVKNCPTGNYNNNREQSLYSVLFLNSYIKTSRLWYKQMSCFWRLLEMGRYQANVHDEVSNSNKTINRWQEQLHIHISGQQHLVGIIILQVLAALLSWNETSPNTTETQLND